MKIKILSLIFAMCLLLSACGGKGTTPTDASKAPSDSTQPAQTEPTGTATEPTEDTASGGPEATEATEDVTVPTPADQYGLVPQSAAVDKSYFDDAAFVGDSVSLKLSYYQAATGALGGAQFFASGSLSAGNALWKVSSESVHPSYQGTKMLVEDCIAKSGAKKIYLMLGMNDIGLYGLEGSIENYKTLVERIKAKSPDVKIFIQSMTPMTTTSNIAGKSLNNTKIKQYNQMLLDTCKEMGWYFIDVGSVMYDANGEALLRSYCSDPDGMGIHFTNEGCEQWVQYLLTHTVNFS